MQHRQFVDQAAIGKYKVKNVVQKAFYSFG